MNRTILSSLICSMGLMPLLTALPARADWEYTRWGMTVEEVMDASQGKATPVDAGQTEPTDTEQALLKSRWQLEQFSFDVSFIFSGDQPKLSQVLLTSSDKNDGMGQALIRKYGVPNQKAEGGLLKTDKPSGPNAPFQLVTEEQVSIDDPGQKVTLGRTPPKRTSLTAARLEWKTPTDNIKFRRQSPTQASITYQPIQAVDSPPAQKGLPDSQS